MAGFFGSIGKSSCVADVFYGTDYHSHLGTRRAGMATFSEENGFRRVIHSIQQSPFRTKFEDELNDFSGNAGIGIISDTDAQPLVAEQEYTLTLAAGERAEYYKIVQ